MMRNLYLFLSFGAIMFVKSASAQFSGQYAPNKWTTTLSNGTGSVSVTGAPSSIILNGSDANSFNTDVSVSFTIAAQASGPWSFNWAYSTTDGFGGADPAFVLKNGVATKITNNAGPNQSGTYSGTAVAGDVIGFRVTAIDDCCGPGILTISSFSAPGGVLPIKLIDFTPKASLNSVKLTWSTASEVSNNRFEIERSTDRVNFTKIGTVPSQGNSNEVQKYSFTDFSPAKSDNYYRLRHFDNDGKSYESDIVAANLRIDNADFGSIYPNPASDVIHMKFNAYAEDKRIESISMFSSNGTLIETRYVNPNKIKGQEFTWDVSKLSRGTYFIRIGQDNKTLAFVKK